MFRPLILGLASALALPLSASARAPLDKPNVVMIYLDDSGYADFSHAGNPTVQTPEVSKLAREGLNFTQFYSGSPACSASRYSLLTGRNPARSGLNDWVLDTGDAKYIHPNEVTLPEGLKARGYATGMFGKWHLGNPNTANQFTPASLPLANGFDEWIGTNVSHDYGTGVHLIRSNPAGTTPIAGYETLFQNIGSNVPVLKSLTGRYREGATSFIRAHKDAPFFVYLAPNMPHLGLFVSDAFAGKSKRGLFGDVMEELDDLIGTVRRTLEEEGIAENTLIILSSDNGPWILYQDQANGGFGDSRLNMGSARPFRDGKGSTWEGGVRVPGIFYWPGTIPARSVSREPACSMDVLPTVFALAGQPLPTGRTLDGRDLRPALNAATFPGIIPPFTYIYTGASSNGVYAARKGPWKLHTKLYSQTGNNYGFTASAASPLLFNVETDPSERFNVAGSQPGPVTELRQVLSDFNASLAADAIFWNN